MIFGPVGLDEAAGAVLAHTHRLPTGILRKGARLDAAAVAALAAAGYERVIAARLEPGDVPEDEAAAAFASTLVREGLAAGPAGTGRVNLHAAQPGLLRVAVATIDRVNRLHESLTVATLPDITPVAIRDMVATVKVIPFAVPGAVLARAADVVRREAPAFTLHPFRPRRTGLVLSELPGMKPSIIEGTIAAMRARIAGLGGTMLPPLRCPHTTDAIAACLRELRAAGAELLLVAGASATVDRRDVGPAAVVAAGGEIQHFGMPVDPGNLICLGRIGPIAALVLPGCARSPRANGIDWVLQRIFADLPIDPETIMGMGVGGLLKEAEARPLPRAKAVTRTPDGAAEPPRAVAAVVLAAGRSTRMAPHLKLLIEDRSGKPMICRVIDNVLASGARPVIVVLGHRAEEVRAAIGGRPVIFAHAPDYAEGLAASLRAGLAAVPESSRAALVCLGDMPLVTGRMLDRVIAAWDPDEGRLIVQPVYQGRPGNPVLWDRRYFPEMAALAGDAGARGLLARHEDVLAAVEMETDAVLRDFDTVESLATLPPALQPANPSPAVKTG